MIHSKRQSEFLQMKMKIKCYSLETIQSDTKLVRSCCTELFRRRSPDRRFCLDLHSRPLPEPHIACAFFRVGKMQQDIEAKHMVWWGPDGKKSYWKHSLLPRLQNIYRNQLLLIISDSWSSIKCGMFLKKKLFEIYNRRKNTENLLLNNQSMHC